MRRLLLQALGAAAAARWLPGCLATLLTRRRVYRSNVDKDDALFAVLEQLAVGDGGGKFAWRIGARTTTSVPPFATVHLV